MRAYLICIIVATLVSSCASPPTASKWSRADYLGKTFSLQDPKIIQDITFSRNHLAPVTFGTRDGDLTKLCAPLMNWQLKHKALEVINYDKTLYEKLQFVDRKPGVIIARNSKGSVVNYFVK